jgi:cytochrome c oxidase assembly protein subunit 11
MKPRRTLTLVAIFVMLAIMTTLTSYSVTLYRLFCQATGANGTTQRVATGSATQTARDITIFFDTNVAPGMPWRFVPVQPSVKLHLGQDALVFFEAQNLSNHDIVGHATFNVTPEKAGIYFKKIQCFCFTEERLAAGAKVQMPVDFFVDPALATDPSTADVHQITLSYTFFESKRPADATNLSRFANAQPDPAAGAKLFAERCSACHAPDHAIIGPALAGIIGRRAGSLPGYPFSPALKNANFTWDDAHLEAWLTNPQQTVPGTTMPLQVPEAPARRDLIAYLHTLHPGS